MNRKVVALVLAAAMLGMTGCGVSQDDYDAAVFAQESAEQELSTSKSDYSSLESTYNSLSDDYASLESTYEELSDSYSSLKDEYDAYKEKMQPYEELDKAEAEAREAKAKQEKAEAEAAEKKKKEEEAAAKKKKEEEEAAAAESKEKMGYDTGITYDNLARNPDDYEGEKVKFYGMQNSAFGHGRHDQSAHVPLSFIGAQHRWSPCVSRVLSFRLAQSQ